MESLQFAISENHTLLIVQKSFLCNSQSFAISQSESRTNPYGDTRRNNKKGKLPRKRKFTLVLHRKRHTVEFYTLLLRVSFW